MASSQSRLSVENILDLIDGNDSDIDGFVDSDSDDDWNQDPQVDFIGIKL